MGSLSLTYLCVRILGRHEPWDCWSACGRYAWRRGDRSAGLPEVRMVKDEALLPSDGIVDHVGEVLDALAAEHEDALEYVSQVTGGKLLLTPNE